MIGIEDVAVNQKTRWRPITESDYERDPKLRALRTKLRNKFEAAIRLEEMLRRSIDELPLWQNHLRDSAHIIHAKIRELKQAADKNNKKIHVVFTGKSAFISEIMLKAAIEKYGPVGLSDKEFTTLSSDDNILLYKSPNSEITKAGQMLLRHGLDQKDQIIMVDDHFGTGIKANGINSSLSKLGYSDVRQIYLTGYPRTNTTEFVPPNTIVASPNLPFTNFMRGVNLLLEDPGLKSPSPNDQVMVKKAFTLLSKLI